MKVSYFETGRYVTPPELPRGMFFALLTTFVVVLAFWIVSFYLRFRNPR